MWKFKDIPEKLKEYLLHVKHGRYTLLNATDGVKEMYLKLYKTVIEIRMID